MCIIILHTACMPANNVINNMLKNLPMQWNMFNNLAIEINKNFPRLEASLE